jgi:hypothetical protein
MDVLMTCQDRNFFKIPDSYRYDLQSEMSFCEGFSTAKLKEKARQMILKFDAESVWSSVNHYNLPALHPEKP